MSESIHDIPAATRKGMLESMVNSPAFALFCDRWEQHIAEDLDKKIFDPETSPEKTHELKLVRKQLTETRHPRKIVETMIRSVGNERPKP